MCPYCSTELSEDKYTGGICPSCHKVFDPLREDWSAKPREEEKQLNPSVQADANILKGKIIEAIDRKSNPFLTVLKGIGPLLGFLFCGSGYLMGFILLFFFPIGTIFGVIILLGATTFLALTILGTLGVGVSIIPGKKYKILCPICQAENEKFVPKSVADKDNPGLCTSCLKRYIIRNGEVLHFK